MKLQQLMSSPEGPPHFPGDHYRMLFTAVSLFKTLYLPEEGVEDVPVGDELLEWLNVHYIEPSTEEGVQLSALQNPWEDELFWPYVIRYCGIYLHLIFRFLTAIQRNASLSTELLSIFS